MDPPVLVMASIDPGNSSPLSKRFWKKEIEEESLHR
jgi:hypothetical protein